MIDTYASSEFDIGHETSATVHDVFADCDQIDTSLRCVVTITAHSSYAANLRVSTAFELSKLSYHTLFFKYSMTFTEILISV